MLPRVRSRSTIRSTNLPVGQWVLTHPSKPTRAGSVVTVQATTGVEEVCCDESHGRPPYSTGGPLYIMRKDFVDQVVTAGYYSRASGDPTTSGLAGYHTDYSGGFTLNKWPILPALPTPPRSPDQHDSFYNRDNLSELGDEAYKVLRPKVEKAGLAQALVESRDIPSMLKQTAQGYKDLFISLPGAVRRTVIRANSGRSNVRELKDVVMPKKAGSQFLNVQFGWIPFLKDLDDTLGLVENYYAHLSKARKANGKWVRRRFTEPTESSSVIVHDTSYTPSSPNYRASFLPAIRGAGQATMRVWSERTTTIWYEGRFRVYDAAFDPGVPMHPQVRSAREFMALAGLNISPVTVWKVTPWSWLADWFSNVGSQLQAIQDWAGGGVASKYMYLMRHTVARYRYEGTQVMSNGPLLTGTGYRSYEVKQRKPAGSPFGFSLSTELNGTQLAILSALGLSHV